MMMEGCKIQGLVITHTPFALRNRTHSVSKGNGKSSLDTRIRATRDERFFYVARQSAHITGFEQHTASRPLVVRL